MAIFEAHPHADDAHRQVMQHRTVTNEFEGPQGSEGGYRISIRQESGLGESGSHSNHVLLGYADIDEAIREAGTKGLHHHVAQIAGEENHTFICGRELTYR